MVYVSSETFLNDLISAIRNDRMDLFKITIAISATCCSSMTFSSSRARIEPRSYFHLFNAPRLP